jgi:ribonuclease HI
MWVLGHVGIQGNKKANQHAKAAQKGETNKITRTTKPFQKTRKTGEGRNRKE